MNSMYKKPVIATVVAIIAIISCYYFENTTADEILKAESTKKILDLKLKMCDDIDKYLGRASDNFYADKPILILDSAEATGVVKIYAPGKGIQPYQPEKLFETKWGEWENNWAPYKITGKTSGDCGIVEFTSFTKDDKGNEIYDEEFEVLVIVK